MGLIEDGGGKNGAVKTTGRQELRTFSVTTSEDQFAVDQGDAYNWNSGEISLSAQTAMLYIKNNDVRTMAINLIAAGVSDNGTHNATNRTLVEIIRNPTTGTLISDANTTGLINRNRNFGSNKTTTNVLIYNASASGKTVTDGDVAFLLYQAAGTTNRLGASIKFDLPTGASCAVRLDPDLSSGSVSAYVALVGHFKDSDR